jgi:hypothetical protein
MIRTRRVPLYLHTRHVEYRAKFQPVVSSIYKM